MMWQRRRCGGSLRSSEEQHKDPAVLFSNILDNV